MSNNADNKVEIRNYNNERESIETEDAVAEAFTIAAKALDKEEGYEKIVEVKTTKNK